MESNCFASAGKKNNYQIPGTNESEIEEHRTKN